jgi:hypothetical protein
MRGQQRIDVVEQRRPGQEVEKADGIGVLDAVLGVNVVGAHGAVVGVGQLHTLVGLGVVIDAVERIALGNGEADEDLSAD